MAISLLKAARSECCAIRFSFSLSFTRMIFDSGICARILSFQNPIPSNNRISLSVISLKHFQTNWQDQVRTISLFCIRVEVHKAKARKDNTCIVLDPFEDKYDHRLYSMTFYNIRIQMSFSYPIILKDLLPGSRLIVNHAVSASESGQHHPWTTLQLLHYLQQLVCEPLQNLQRFSMGNNARAEESN